MDRSIAVLNNLLGAELGFNFLSEPIYRWKWSENWFHTYLSTEMEPVTKPSGLVVYERKAKTRRMCLQQHEQWVLAKWCPPHSESDWAARFGDKLPYPSRGYLAPTNVVLEPGVLPDTAVTLQVIGLIRKERQNTMADYINRAEEAIDRREKRKKSRLDDAIRDCFTAFANPKPGARGNHVSLPDPHNNAAEQQQ